MRVIRLCVTLWIIYKKGKLLLILQKGLDLPDCRALLETDVPSLLCTGRCLGLW